MRVFDIHDLFSLEKSSAMEETRSEVLRQQKELLGKLTTQLMYIRKMENSQEKILDLFGHNEKIKDRSQEVATDRVKQKEQELLKLMDGAETDRLKFQEKSKELKRKIPDRRHISKKSKTEVEENNHSCEEEGKEEEEEENEELEDPILTPIKPLKKIKLKREKNMVKEDYEKNIRKLEKKIKSQELTITLSQEQQEKEFQEKQTQKENLLMELSKEYSTMKLLFQENGFQETINKLSQICEKITKEDREKQSNGHGPGGKDQQSETSETPVDNQKFSKKLDEVAKKQEKLKSELLAAQERAQKILEKKDAEIKKIKELHAEKDKKVKLHLSEDREKVGLAIKEKEIQSQKIQNLEESLKSSESKISRLQRLVAEKDVQIKHLESSNSECFSKISNLEEKTKALKKEKDQAKRLLDEKEKISEKTSEELTSLKSAHEEMKKLIENFESEDSREAPLSAKDRESSDTSAPGGTKKDLEKLKLEIRQLEENIIDKDKQIADANKRCFQEAERLKESLEENAKLKDSRGQMKTAPENHNKSVAETQTENGTDHELQNCKEELKTRKNNCRKAEAQIRSLEKNLEVEKIKNTNLNKEVTKKSRMLKNIAKKYVKLKKDETYNADSIKISATIIENLEKKLAGKKKTIEKL